MATFTLGLAGYKSRMVAGALKGACVIKVPDLDCLLGIACWEGYFSRKARQSTADATVVFAVWLQLLFRCRCSHTLVAVTTHSEHAVREKMQSLSHLVQTP